MPISTGEPRLFRSAKPILGESLVWDPDGDLLWCDITAGLLHRSPADGSIFGADDGTSALPAPVASFGPAARGGFVVSLGDRVITIDVTGRETGELARIEHAQSGMRLNEGKADPAGRWVTGSMNVTAEDPADPASAVGALYSIEETDSGIRQRVLRGGFGVANGLEWSPDGRTIYFTDTSVKTIYRGDYSADGEIGEVEVFHVGEDHDGLVMDIEGYLWSGIYGAGRVVRYTPDGVEDLSISLPSPNVTSVAFGGPDLSTLYVSSARENLTEQQLRANPLAGAIFAIDTSTSGYPVRTFGRAASGSDS